MAVKKQNKSLDTQNSELKRACAKLRNCPTSPRKMRLVVDQIRGLDVNKALVLLKHSSKEASRRFQEF